MPHYSLSMFVVLLLLLAAAGLHAQPVPATQPAQARELVAEVLGQPVYRDELPQPPQPLDRISEYGSAISRRIIGPLTQGYLAEHAVELTPTDEELAQAAAYFDQYAARDRAEQRPRREQQLREIEVELAQPNMAPDERQRLEIRRNVMEGLTLSHDEMVQRIAEIKSKLTVLPPDAPEQRSLEMRKANLEAELQPKGRMLAEAFLPNWKFQRHLYDRYGGGRILFQQAGLEAFDATRAWLESEERAGRLKFHDPHVREAVFLYWNVDHGSFLSDKPKQIEKFLNPPWLADRTDGP